MAQIYKVFFNKISFEIKPFSVTIDKTYNNLIFDCFFEFVNALNFELKKKQKNKKRLILKSKNIEKDWRSLLVTLNKFDLVIASGGIIQNNLNESLFIYRNGFWDLPKGKVEKNEKLVYAAKREIFEECGLKNLEYNSFIAKTHHIYFENGKGKLKETNWFSFYCYNSQVLKPQLEEGITEIKWVQKKYLQFYLNKSFSSIEELFKYFFK
tara:strand:- start:21200 stop:21829 length:630 start_codon:yes stop_codon:yes gene_type:complete